MSWFANFTNSFFDKVFSGFIGFIVGITCMYLYKKIKEFLRRRKLTMLFGGKKGKFYIVHSAIFDDERQAYDYPACDTTAARYVSSILSSCGFTEEKDYFILPDTMCKNESGHFKSEIIQENLVCICSPKRNNLTNETLGKANFLNYKFVYSEKYNHQIFINSRTPELEYASSRDNGFISKIDGSEYDYAYIASFPNPNNHERRVFMFFGIHGAGTKGAAKFILKKENRAKLEKLLDRRVAETLIKIVYSGKDEKIISEDLI